jgi:hypothetical protein
MPIAGRRHLHHLSMKQFHPVVLAHHAGLDHSMPALKGAAMAGKLRILGGQWHSSHLSPASDRVEDEALSSGNNGECRGNGLAAVTRKANCDGHSVAHSSARSASDG